MPYKLLLNGETILSGDLKSLRQTFNSLSGLAFKRTEQSNWLNKMTARESYAQYLHIMARELKVEKWDGLLQLVDHTDAPESAHLFTAALVNQPEPSAKESVSDLNTLARPANSSSSVRPSMASSLQLASPASKKR